MVYKLIYLFLIVIMKIHPIPLSTILITSLGLISTPLAIAQSYDGSPYTAWQNDYTGNEANTLLLWKFDNDNPSSNYGYDYSGGGHNATFHSTGTQTGVSGKFGTSFLSGPDRSSANDSYARNTASSDVFNGSALSVEFWFRPVVDGGTTSTLSHMVDKRYADPGVGLLLTFRNTEGGNQGYLALSVGNGTTLASLNTAGLDWDADTWYHIAVTFENVDGDGIMKIFRDGKEAASRVVDDFGDIDPGTRWWNLANRIGSSYGSMPGYYDNFRISDVAYNYSAIPEPATAMLLIAIPVLLFWIRKRSNGATR